MDGLANRLPDNPDPWYKRLLNVALAYASLGWLVLPMHGVDQLSVCDMAGPRAMEVAP